MVFSTITTGCILNYITIVKRYVVILVVAFVQHFPTVDEKFIICDE